MIALNIKPNNESEGYLQQMMQQQQQTPSQIDRQSEQHWERD